jgi:sugar lactone lactonase YvrE
MYLFNKLFSLSKNKLSLSLLLLVSMLFDGSIISNAASMAAKPGRLMGGAIQGSPLKLTAEVTFFAGSGNKGAAEGLGAEATFRNPIGITTDGNNLYVADTSNNKIRKIVIATGSVTTLAGSGTKGGDDGDGAAASFNYPVGITTDGTNLYIGDTWNQKIRKIVIASGVVTTLAGSGHKGAEEGTGTAASFSDPDGITTDGKNLYVVDSGNHKIRKIIIATGVVSTLAGSGTQGKKDGTATDTSFQYPHGITTDGRNLYVADSWNSKIRKIVIATGVVTTIAGSGAEGALDGTGKAATFNSPNSVTTDGSNLYVSDEENNIIRKIEIATGVVTTLAGSGEEAVVEGVGKAASFNKPTGITTDGKSLYVVDKGRHLIRKIN